MGAGVILAQIVRVVGGDEGDAHLRREAGDSGDEAFILLQTVVLQFEEEVVLAEDFGVGASEIAGFGVVVAEERFVEIAAETGREADDAFRMLGEQILVDAGLIVEAFEVAGRDQFDEIAVAFLVFAEQDQVVVAIVFGAGLVAVLIDVDLAAKNGMDAFIFGGVVKLDGAEHVAVVGHGDGGLFELRGELHELLDFACAVEQRVVGVAMEMDKRDVRTGNRHDGAIQAGETSSIIFA